MRCIFCKSDSGNSVSIEHILPESIGNNNHILPKGAVCDQCNNYFARKLEKPLLDSLHFRSLRARQKIPNKRGLVPPHMGQLCKFKIGLWPDNSIAAINEGDEKQLIKYLQSNASGTIIVPAGDWPVNERAMARFLSNVGLEVLTQRVYKVYGWNDEIVGKQELDDLRRFARWNEGSDWPYHMRRIYDEDQLFYDDYKVLHEYSLLWQHTEIYLILCLFGMEYALNLGGRTLDGYRLWLKENQDRSPLYSST
jgi:hypothetical protein